MVSLCPTSSWVEFFQLSFYPFDIFINLRCNTRICEMYDVDNRNSGLSDSSSLAQREHHCHYHYWLRNIVASVHRLSKLPYRVYRGSPVGIIAVTDGARGSRLLYVSPSSCKPVSLLDCRVSPQAMCNGTAHVCGSGFMLAVSVVYVSRCG